jgi:hypothetical protein
MPERTDSQTQPIPPTTTPRTKSARPGNTEGLGNEPRTGFNHKPRNRNVATFGNLYSNQNKYSNQTDSDQNKNCDNKLGTDAKNTENPILQSIQKLLTEFRQSRQPLDRANTRPTTTLTPKAVVNPTTPQILTTTLKGVTSLTTPPTSKPTRKKESLVYRCDKKPNTAQTDTAKTLEIISTITSVLGLEGTAESLTA